MKLTHIGALLFLGLGISTIFACSKTVSEDQQMLDYIAKKGWVASTTPQGMYYVQDTSALGSGAYPTSANTVTVKYKGYLTDDTVFDSNSTTGYPANLSPTAAQGVIQGWQIGIPKFKKGGKGHLLIPSSLGYGATGSGSIPGNVPIIFDIEVVSFK